MDEKKKKSKVRGKKLYGCILGLQIGLNILSIIAESNFTAAFSMFLGIMLGIEVEKLIIDIIIARCKHG